MINRLIQQFARLFSRGSVRQTEITNLSAPARPLRKSVQYGANRAYPRQRPNRNGSFQNHASGDGYRHNAERLLRDGHLRIAITGFNDTTFDVSVMGRHDAPDLRSSSDWERGQFRKSLPEITANSRATRSK